MNNNKAEIHTVGVLTFHKAMNYGAVLQTYALVCHLREIGVKPTVIDLTPGDHDYITALLVPPTKPYLLKQDILAIASMRYLRKRKRDFAHFVEKRVPLSSQRSVRTSELRSILNQYDAVVCGSDQIWNPELRDSDLGFFVPEGDGFRRIAYGASMGSGHLEDYENPTRVREALMGFDAISVRELTTKEKLVEFCKPATDPFRVIDPTLLAGEKAFDNIVAPPSLSKPYIFVYSVRGRKETYDAAKALSRRTGLPYYTLFAGIPKRFFVTEGRHIPQGDNGPSGFLSLVKNAEWCITDSFHGTVFALLFQRKFFVVSYVDENGKEKRDERISSLCDDFGIEKQVVLPGEIESADLSFSFDWDDAERTRMRLADASSSWLKTALLKGEDVKSQQDEQAVPHKLCPPSQCTGCSACKSVCPVGAIEFTLSNEGRLLPSFSAEDCVGCNACSMVCPQMSSPRLEDPRKCLAAQRKGEERWKSASGGIASLMSEAVVSRGGYVYGAIIDEDLTVRHVRADSKEVLNKIRLSKYAKSEMGDIFRDVKKQLVEGRDVLFIGTPCQVSGLRSFLRKPYPNLTCIDLVCHGTPPMEYLRQHIAAKGLYPETYAFRGGETDLVLSMRAGQSELYRKAWWEDEYYFAFMVNISLDECCYSCPYARKQRIGDITVGDFWKLDRDSLHTEMDGRISLVLINTDKGEEEWSQIAGMTVNEERVFDECLPGNPNLSHPSEASHCRESFINEYRVSGDFERAFTASSALVAFQNERKKRMLAHRILRKLKRIFFGGDAQ